MLGRDVNLPVDVMVGKPPVPNTAPCYVQYVEWVSHATEQAFAHARDSLRAAAERQKRNFDVGVKLMTFNEGDLVWFYYPPRKSKLGVPWIGPFRVRRCLSNHTYEIVRTPGGKARITHVDNLRPYNGQDSSNEPATADDEFPEEHVTRDDVPEKSTLPTADVSWEELPDTDALGNDADIPKRCRRRPRYLDDYV